MKNEFYDIQSGTADLAKAVNEMQATKGDLQKKLIQHKHAMGSGEAVIPMEAS